MSSTPDLPRFACERPSAPVYWATADGRGSVRAHDWPLWPSNALFYLATLPAACSTRVRWRRPPTALEACAAGGQTLLFYGWHRYNWLAYHALRSLPASLRPLAIAHDGLASRWNHRVAAWLGFPTFVFRRRAELRPREQIIAFLRARPQHLLLFPDSGGPYGVIKPGIVEIARALGMRPVPFVIHSDPDLRLGPRLRHQLPCPFASLELVLGPALGPESVDAAGLHAALSALEADERQQQGRAR